MFSPFGGTRPCASPEPHKVSEWGHRCLSRLRFLRPKGRPPLIHSRPVSPQHARLDSTLSGVSRHPVPLSGWDGGREPRPAASTRHLPAIEARPSSPHFVGPSPGPLSFTAFPRGVGVQWELRDAVARGRGTLIAAGDGQSPASPRQAGRRPDGFTVSRRVSTPSGCRPC
jgi:hypothetical protein